MLSTISFAHSMHAAGQPCAQQNVFNITDSQALNTTLTNICLACLFNGATLTTSGTVWTAFGQPISTSQNVVVVNPNGTLIITFPPGAISNVPFSCQSNGVVFNITVSCKSQVNSFVHPLNIGII